MILRAIDCISNQKRIDRALSGQWIFQTGKYTSFTIWNSCRNNKLERYNTLIVQIKLISDPIISHMTLIYLCHKITICYSSNSKNPTLVTYGRLVHLKNHEESVAARCRSVPRKRRFKGIGNSLPLKTEREIENEKEEGRKGPFKTLLHFVDVPSVNRSTKSPTISRSYEAL